jgi:hypothetical protein
MQGLFFSLPLLIYSKSTQNNVLFDSVKNKMEFIKFTKMLSATKGKNIHVRTVD